MEHRVRLGITPAGISMQSCVDCCLKLLLSILSFNQLPKKVSQQRTERGLSCFGRSQDMV